MDKITIKIDGQEEYEFEGDCEFIQERGLIIEYDTNGTPKNIKPNGHYRTVLKMWKGCKDFNSFKGREEI